MTQISVSSLHLYPVKSLRGIALAEASVEARGLRHDRRWMLVGEDGVFLSQRECPQMARVPVAVTEDGLHFNAEGMAPLLVPFQTAAPVPVTVRVWRSVCEAQYVGGTADAWFTAFLGRPCRLVTMPDATRRLVNPDFAVRPGDDIVSFADAYPLLLIGEASLADLNTRLAHPLPMDRFRPNVVVTGTAPFEEDDWTRLRIGDCLFHVVKSCDRCGVTTIDQQTGERGLEPLTTLAKYRKRDGKVFFGRYLIPDAPGRLRVSDPVEVVEKSAAEA